jgi:phage terminase small subunit
MFDHITHPQKRAFLVAYAECGRVTEAAAAAGVSRESHYDWKAGDPEYRKAFELAVAEAAKNEARRAKERIQRVLEEYDKLAFFDIRKAFDAEGRLLPIHEIDDTTAAAIAGVEVEELFAGRGESRECIGKLHKIRLLDRKGALDSLAKHLGMFPQKVEHTTPDGQPLPIRVVFVGSKNEPKDGGE